MKKQLLLAAAAVTALVAAGSAQAASISYRAGTGAITDPALASNRYTLARELNFTNGVVGAVGDFDFIFNFQTALTSGTYTVQLDLTNATFTAAQSNATVTSTGLEAGANIGASVGFVTATAGTTANATLTLASGGAVGGSSATYTLQIPAGATVTSIGISPAINVKGAVTVTGAARNQVTLQPVENSVIQPVIEIATDPAFAARVNGRISGADAVTFGSGAGLDTRVDDGTTGDPFNSLTNPGQVGQVDLAVAGDPRYDVILGRTSASTARKRDLVNGNVALTDVTSTAINVQGSLSGLTFSGLGAAALTTSPANGQSATSVTLSGAPDQTLANSTYTISAVASATGDRAPQLAPTELPVSATMTLSAIYAAQPAFTGNFETLQTDGVSYVIPWVTSNAFGQITGSTSVIRISNIGTDIASRGGRVYGQLYNPSNIAGVVTTSRTFNFGTLGGLRQGDSLIAAANAGPSIGAPIAPGAPGALTAGQAYASGIPQSAAPAELVIGSVELQNAFGDFGRGDLRLTITDTSDLATDNGNASTNPDSIVVKRVIRSANGSLTEMTVVAGGTGVAPVDQQVPY